MAGLHFPFCGNDFSSSFALSFGLSCHGSLHFDRQIHAFYFYVTDLDAPRICLRIKNLLKIFI